MHGQLHDRWGFIFRERTPLGNSVEDWVYSRAILENDGEKKCGNLCWESKPVYTLQIDLLLKFFIDYVVKIAERVIFRVTSV